ncbi:3-hydroxyisobutyrate dehydrogenase [Amycolatopsis mediterranei S699]|uniref:3-hydroxyisobutyrate dehydrogenase n=2 Tax=Amycolatopsis mediterranei TaxID=33910 RepID=A0A0H3DC19_AMYMU|nr:NAD(P)-dependent oxidoreductase [Amycolatopsis mediterranei]ADJ47184.1 3-hydroxyisobutyrate dehydrogenase [Amycolatopsis mediterranei U32]AEK44007.1 3-hydroxyisobutyrate dehydrogenase [Amycolatopsis mediterranei S699]AFO78895.1 3-hydroxyisobutyrate dehydrogenase [Amycolatopsis mediterranei S699]AGT86023.1 3-hydroxyisobutyrate dehydrogenase [Amycolatopsis mediterranei RB]KDO04469.1 3-hydroxyisobutyrate dehydrogenase [Amycolatopsis mediterranei]
MDTKTIAVLGLGVMGSGMATSLLDHGYRVLVHNRTAAKAAPLLDRGAELAESAEAAVAGADRVLLSLADEPAVDAVLAAAGPAIRAGLSIVDTSTVSAGYSRSLTARLADEGVTRIEACVLGNPAQAAAGQLRVLAAGARAAVESAGDVLDAIGREVSYLGPIGNAATTKLVFNLLLGGQVAALAEAVNYGVAAGLDRDRLLTAIGASGFSSKVLSFRAELMRSRRYEPAAFRSALMAKDLRLGTGAAAEAGVGTPVLTAAALAYEAVVAAGAGDADAAILIEVADEATDLGRRAAAVRTDLDDAGSAADPGNHADAAILIDTPGGSA